MQSIHLDRIMHGKQENHYRDNWGNVNMNYISEDVYSELILPFFSVIKIMVIKNYVLILRDEVS